MLILTPAFIIHKPKQQDKTLHPTTERLKTMESLKEVKCSTNCIYTYTEPNYYTMN